jgi:DNA polymerase V
MMDYSKQQRHKILCVDMKSFFATCECVERGFDPLKKKLAVVGKKDHDGSVVLAASPSLKKLGIKTGSRLYEIKNLKDDTIIITQARMGLYQDISDKIRNIFEEFVPPDHIDVYSIDEAWLTLDGTQGLWGEPWQAAAKLIKRIKEETGIIATVGIGDNKFLAKVVLDNYAKHHGIAQCGYEDVEVLIHPLSVEDMWGIGEKTKNKLHKMKVYTIGDLAKKPPEILKKSFGVIGMKYHFRSNGIDDSIVTYKDGNGEATAFGRGGANTKSVGRGVTLTEDYKENDDILLVIKELLEEIGYILRQRNEKGKLVHLTLEYSRKDGIDGFSRQLSIKNYENDAESLFEGAKKIFYQFHKNRKPVRKIRVSVGDLIIAKNESVQNKKTLLNETRDDINNRFGKGTLIKASSLQKKSISKEQNKKIKGHYE